MTKNFILAVKLSLAFLALIILTVYFLHQTRGFLLGPKLVIDYPSDGQAVGRSFITVKGSALNASKLTVNGGEVLFDANGKFEKELLLAKGYNIIGFSAIDRFGRSINKKLQIVLK